MKSQVVDTFDATKQPAASGRVWVVAVATGMYLLSGLAVWGLLQQVFLPVYAELEREDLLGRLSRARRGLQDEHSRVADFAAGWAQWADTFAEVAAPTGRFVEEHLQPEGFDSIDIDIALLVDHSGNAVIALRRDEDRVVPIDPDMVSQIVVLPSLVADDPKDVGPAELRIARIGGVVRLLAAHPVRAGVGRGPSNGTLILGRTLDDAALAPFREDSPGLRVVAAAEAAGEGAVELKGGRVVGTLPLARDPVAGAWDLQIDLSRVIWDRGRRSANFLLAGSSIVGLGVAAGYVALTLMLLEARSEGQRREAQRAHRLAFHDHLTGLPNRLLFQEHLRTAIARRERTGEPLAVAYLDLDDFKEVNDTLGHDEGDRLLIEVSRRLEGGVRAGDVVARQGGDEFLLLLPRITSADEAMAVCNRMLAAVRAQMNLGGRELRVGASLGLAIWPDDGRDAAALVHHADLAMYAAKEAGRDRMTRFDGVMARRESTVLQTRAELARALERGEFRLVYQPLYDLASRRMEAVEALIRWHPPGEEVRPPAVFLPAAERSGLIVQIGAWVLDEALRQIVAWRAAGLAPVRVAINLSDRQVIGPDFVKTVQEVLAKAGVEAGLLEFDIHESLALRDLTIAGDRLSGLRALGATLALDDFGSGRSSISHMRELPFDRVKIDHRFIATVDSDPRQAALVGGMVSIAHACGLRAVAEGVEREAQIAVLLTLGCDLAQGFALHRPAGPDEVAALFTRA